MSLPNFGTALTQLNAQIYRIWKTLNEKVNNVVTTNPDGTITLGTITNPVSNLIMNSCIWFGVISGDALCIYDLEGVPQQVFDQFRSAKIATFNTYIGLNEYTPYGIMRDNDGCIITIVAPDGFYAVNEIGWTKGEVYPDFEEFIVDKFGEQIPYCLPASDLLKAGATTKGELPSSGDTPQ